MNFEFGSDVLQQSTSTSTSNTDSESTLNVQKTSDYQFKYAIDGCDQAFDSEDTIENDVKEHFNTDVNSNNIQDNYVNITDKGAELVVCSYEGCNMIFQSNQALSRHTKSKHSSRKGEHKWSCYEPGCQFATNIYRQIYVHKTYIHSNQMFVCGVKGCDSAFKFKVLLNRHMRILHSVFDKHYKYGQKWSCNQPNCQFETTSYLQIKIHKKSHLVRLYVCTEQGCHKKFAMKALLKNHKEVIHNVFGSRPQVKDNVSNVSLSNSAKFLCPIIDCARVYSTKRNLGLHIERGHSGRRVICSHKGCDKTFPTEQQMKEHMIRVHIDAGYQVKCDWPGCQYVGRKPTLYAHRQRHTPKPNVCNYPDCGQTFSNKERLKDHKHDVHNPDKLLTCRRLNCNFETYKAREMKRHSARHSSWHSCDWPECGKMFKSRYQLVEHINAHHKNIKPYVCPEPDCPFRTAYRSSYEGHVKMHSHPESLRRYACVWPECGYVTSTNTMLKIHVRNHTNEKPYECQHPGCAMKFKTSDRRNAHRKETHSQERNFICDCGKRFKVKRGIRRHKQNSCPYKK